MKRQVKHHWPLFLFPVIAFAVIWWTVVLSAVETTTLQGKVIMPDGTPATKGKVFAQLSQPGTTPDTTTATQQIVGGRDIGSIGATGDVTLVLVPNDVITPSGTFYDITISVQSPIRASWTERWLVDSTPDPVDIGAITRIDVAPGVTIGNFVKHIATEPSGACLVGTDTTTWAIDTDRICECVSSTWRCGVHIAAQFFGPTASNCDTADVVLNAVNDFSCATQRMAPLFITQKGGDGRAQINFQEGLASAGMAMDFFDSNGVRIGIFQVNTSGAGIMDIGSVTTGIERLQFRYGANAIGEVAINFTGQAGTAMTFIDDGVGTSNTRKMKIIWPDMFMDYQGSDAIDPLRTRLTNVYGYYAYYSYDYSFSDTKEIDPLELDDDWDQNSSTPTTVENVRHWLPRGEYIPREVTEGDPVCNLTTLKGALYFRDPGTGRHWNWCDGAIRHEIPYTGAGATQSIAADTDYSVSFGIPNATSPPTVCAAGDLWMDNDAGADGVRLCCCDADEDADGVFEFCDASDTAC